MSFAIWLFDTFVLTAFHVGRRPTRYGQSVPALAACLIDDDAFFFVADQIACFDRIAGNTVRLLVSSPVLVVPHQHKSWPRLITETSRAPLDWRHFALSLTRCRLFVMRSYRRTRVRLSLIRREMRSFVRSYVRRLVFDIHTNTSKVSAFVRLRSSPSLSALALCVKCIVNITNYPEVTQNGVKHFCQPRSTRHRVRHTIRHPDQFHISLNLCYL